MASEALEDLAGLADDDDDLPVMLDDDSGDDLAALVDDDDVGGLADDDLTALAEDDDDLAALADDDDVGELADDDNNDGIQTTRPASQEVDEKLAKSRARTKVCRAVRTALKKRVASGQEQILSTTHHSNG